MKLHLLFTSIITENRRRVHLGTQNLVNRSRVNVFLSTLESLRLLPISSADFYIEYDETTIWAGDFITKQILALPFEVKVHRERLSRFEDWKSASKSQTLQNSDQLIFFANDDHIFIQSNLDEFLRCSQVQRQAALNMPDSTIMTILTHFPESHATIPIARATNTLVDFKGDQLVPVATPIGAVLMTPKDFEDWFKSDFTNGQLFVGPENPFGPSLILKEGYYIVPKVELFRHLDAYSHVGLVGWPYQVMDVTLVLRQQDNLFSLEKQPWMLTSDLAEPNSNQANTYLRDSNLVGDVRGFASSIIKAFAIRPSFKSLILVNTIYRLNAYRIILAIALAFRYSSRFRCATFRIGIELPALFLLFCLTSISGSFPLRLKNSSYFPKLLGASSFGLYEFYILGKLGALKYKLKNVFARYWSIGKICFKERKNS